MKAKFYTILSLLFLLIITSCGRNKGMFILYGTVQDETDSILIVGLDYRFKGVDTILCSEGHFKWSFRPDTVTTLILVLPDGRQYPVFAEKDLKSTVTIPGDTGTYTLTGGYCNESYCSFHEAALQDSTLEQAIARIDSFITANPFSEVTPYLIYNYMVKTYHADKNDIQALVKRMSGNMQDAPYLVSLKSEFKGALPNNTYLDNVSLTDSAGYKYPFIDVGGNVNHILVCVWASWTGNEGLRARDTLNYFLDKYKERSLSVVDISVDVNKELWKEVIVKDTVKWFSYNDPWGWESKFIISANVQSIPVFILLSGAKRLLFQTDSFEKMDKELDSVLPKKKEEPKPKPNSRSRTTQPETTKKR